MSVKAICFDVDGVLVDADKWHFNSLNVALQHSDIEPISWQEHLTIYKGIPTKRKLEILTERKGLPVELYDRINKSKQDLTMDIIAKFCTPDPEKLEMMRLLRKNYRLHVCSNAIRQTVEAMLQYSGLKPYVDLVLSNEDVRHPKPDPEIYLKTFAEANCDPTECVVVEDSYVGYRAAVESGAWVCKVDTPQDVNYYSVLRAILDANRLNVVIPAGGYGKRFTEAGYQHPKPLIDVGGRPMLELVLDNFKGIGRIIVVMQKQHIVKYCVESILKNLDSTIEVVAEEGVLRGAATGVLVAKDLINTNNELIIANSDQYIDYDLNRFIRAMRDLKADGGILTFKADSPKWSYAAYDATGRVTEVAEKHAISEMATSGVYYYRHGREFVQYAEQMIAKGIKTNNEFYVCPVYNEYIAAGKRVYIHAIDSTLMHGLGTPEDLSIFLSLRQ